MKKILQILSLAALLCVPWATGAQQTLPYSMNFEDATLFTGVWTLNNCDGETGINASAKRSGSYGFRFYGYNNQTPPQYLISPELSGANGVQVSFWYKKQNANGVDEAFQVGYSTTTNATNAFTWYDGVTATDSWVNYSTMFPAGTKYVAIRYTTEGQYGLYVDDIAFSELPTCSGVYNVKVATITNNGATVTWSTLNANTATYTIKNGNTTLATTAAGATSYPLTGLSAATTYNLTITSNCGNDGTSDAVSVPTFVTLCEPLTVNANSPFSENFNSLQSGIPSCWYNNEGTTTTDEYKWNYDAAGHTGACVKFDGLNNNAGKTNQLATRPLQLEANATYTLTFWYNKPGSDVLLVYISTNGGVTKTAIATNLGTTDDWTEHTVDLSEYAGQTVRIYFEAASDGGNVYLDDVTIEGEAVQGVTLPYTMDFEDEDEYANWTLVSCASGTGKNTGAKRNGTYGFKFQYNTNPPQYFISPEFSCPSGVQIEFYYKRSGSWTEIFQVGYSITDNDVSSFTWDNEVTATDSWTLYSSLYPAGTKYVAIRYNANDQLSLYIDDIELTVPPTCPKPTEVTVTGVTANSVTVSWNDNTNGGSEYYIYTSEGGLVCTTAVAATTATIVGLSSETNYAAGDYYIVANCGNDGMSAHVNVPAFYTGYCQPTPTSVDGSNGAITNVSFGTGNNVVNNSNHPTASPYYGNYSAQVGAVAAGTTANINVTYSTSSFKYTTIIWVDWNNNLTFEGSEVVFAGDATNSQGENTFSFNIDANQALGDYRMRIAGADSYYDSYNSMATAVNANPCPQSQSYCVVHDYTLRVTEAPSCLAVTEVTVSGITTTGATITWATANAASTTYTIKNGDQVIATTAAGATSYTLTTLTPATPYNLTITANCGAQEQSDPATVPAFKTECEAVASISENFDGYTTGDNVLPDCWKYINTTTYSYYKVYPKVYNYGANSPSNCLYFYSYNYDPQDQYAILPPMTSVAGKEIVLQAKGYDANSTFKIGVMTDPTDASTFTEIATQALSTDYKEYTYSVPANATGNYIAIMMEAANSTTTTKGVYIDDVTVQTPPACRPVQNISFTNVERTSFTVNWENHPSATNVSSYQVVIDVDNLDAQSLESANSVTCTTTNYTFTGLNRETDYYVYVRANCGNDGYGEWVEAEVTTHGLTFCEDVVVASGSTTNSYLPLYGGYMDDPVGTQTIYPASMLTSLVGKTISGLHYYVSSGDGNSWTDTKPLLVKMMVVDEATLTGFVDVANATTVFDGLLVGSAINTTNGFEIQFTQNFTYTGGNLLIAMQANPNDVSGFSGVYFLGVNATDASRYGYGSSNYNFTASGTSQSFLPKVDFVYCESVEACPAVTNITVSDITETTATVSWTPSTGDYIQGYWIDTTDWWYPENEYRTWPSQEAEYVQGGNSSEYTLENLRAYTPYYVVITPDCNESIDGNGTPEATYFRTASACRVPANITATQTGKNTVTVSWEAGSTEQTQNYQYFVEYGQTNGVDFYNNGGEPDVINNLGNVTSVELTNVPNNTWVNFYLRNNCGNTGYSPWVLYGDLRTYPEMPAVVNLQATQVTHSAIAVTWERNTAQFADEEKWMVECSGVPCCSTSYSFISHMDTMFLGLTPSTEYHIKVKPWKEVSYGDITGDEVEIVVNTEAMPTSCEVVADGTVTNSNVPVYGNWADAYLKSHFVYPAEMLSALNGKEINQMTFFLSTSAAAAWTGTFDVYVSEVAATTISSYADVSGMTQVYTGTLDATGSTMTITFANNYTYNGGNLLVAIEQSTKGNYKSATFYGVSSTGSSIYGYNSSALASVTATQADFLPKVQFCYQLDPNACLDVTNVSITNVTANSAEISWMPGNTESAWRYMLSGTEYNPTAQGTGAGNPINVTHLSLSQLTVDFDYLFWIRPVDAQGNECGNWVSFPFSTLASCGLPTLQAATNVTTTTATISATPHATIGTASTYTFRYWIKGEENHKTTVAASANNSANLTNLTPNTTYYYEAMVSCTGNDGDSRWTEPMSFTTEYLNTTLPYSTNFSTSYLDDQHWRLVNGNLTNAWAIGSAADAADDGRALYVSNDGGVTNAYTISGANSVTYAYAGFSNFEADKQYTVIFDWKNRGENDSYDYLRAWLVPDNEEFDAYNPGYSMPYATTNPTNWIAVDGGSYLNNVTEWQHQTTYTFVPADGAYKLVFMWANDGSMGTNPPAAVDNVMIQESNKYTVTANVSPNNAGIAAPTGGGQYYEQRTATVMAADAPYGYEFLGWSLDNSDEIVSTENPYTFTITTSDVTVTAVYDSLEYTITAEAGEGGSATGTATVKYNKTVLLEATAEPCYQFVNWTKNQEVMGTDASITVQASANATYRANFELRTITGDTTAVECDEFTWHGETYYDTPVQAPTFGYITNDGCDSTVTLHLTIRNSSDSTLTVVACDSYVMNLDTHEETYYETPAQMPMFHFLNAVGCDSTVTLNLTINHSTTGDTTAVACDEFTWYGDKYTMTPVTALPNHTFQNAAGCDSTVTLHLTINHSTTGDTTAVACDEYEWYEHTNLTMSSDDLTHTFTNMYDCDSVVTLHLTVNNSNLGDTSVVACDRYTWINQVTYEATPDVAPTVTLQNAAGCDSVVTLNLTIKYSSTGVDKREACDSYQWINGRTYTTSNDTAVYTLTNVAGCDSVVTLNLVINNSTTGDTTVVACDEFQWINQVTYDATPAEAPTFTLENEAGCDSTVTLHLTINNSSTGDTAAVACNTFSWYEHTNLNSSSDNLTHTFVNNDGCDSVVTLHLTINNSNAGDTTVVACDQFTWINQVTYDATPADNPTFTLQNANASGCDSTVTLHLTINTSTAGVDNQTACDNYEWINGRTYTASNDTAVYIIENGNAKGCDSTVTLNLVINTSTTGDTAAVACDQFSWYEHTNLTMSSDDLTHTFENENGCDSVVTLTLTVNKSNTGVDDTTVCDEFTWINQVTYDATPAVAPTFTLQNAAGCDSVVTLNLTVNYSTTGDTTVVACDEFQWINQVTYEATPAVAPTFTLQNAAGCDSVVTLNLTVNHSTDTAITVDILENQLPYTFNGETFQGAVTNRDITIENAAGCDSVIHFTLNVEWNSTNTVDSTICAEQLPFTWNNTVFTEAGTQSAQLTSVSGADSTVVMTLHVHATVSSDTAATACDNFTWYDIVYAESTIDTHAVPHHVTGCDSLIILHLTINNSTEVADTLAICNGYLWHDSVYAESGVYTYETENQAGCTQTETLVLTVNVPVNETLTVAACDAYTWNNTEYTQSGEYTYSHPDANNCNQIDTLRLTINNSVVDSIAAVACDSYQWTYAIEPYVESGRYVVASETEFGCSETHILNLTINNSTETADTLTICTGYLWHDSVYTESGVYTYETENQAGCTHTETLVLTVNVPVNETLTVAACDAYTWNNTEYTESGEYTFSHPDNNNCTQVDTLRLTISNSAVDSIVAVACDSYVWMGDTITESGVYSNVEEGQTGCSITHVLTLTVNNSTETVDSLTICNGYLWHDSVYAESGVYTYVTENQAGCTQTETLVLNVNLSVVDSVDTTVCNWYVWNDTMLGESGRYVATSVSDQGCTDTHILNLTVNYNSSYAFSQEAVGSFEWYDSVYTESGTYTHVLTNAAGCDSVINMTLTITPSNPCLVTELPWNEGFEGVTGTAYSTAGVMPDCWTVYSTGTNAAYIPHVVTGNSTYSYQKSGINSLALLAGTSATYGTPKYAILPEMARALNELQLSFWMCTEGSTGTLTVGYVTGDDTTGFTPINSYAASTATQHSGNGVQAQGVGQDVLLYLNAVPATAKHLVFKWEVASSYYTCCIDDVVIDELPSCYMVQNLVVDGVTSNSMTLTWNDNLNNGATYSVYNGEALVASGITATTYTVTGLESNTEYTFGVVANCSANDASDVVTASGRTACGMITELPWTDGMENVPTGSNQMPWCWTRYVSVAATEGLTSPYSASGTGVYEGSRFLNFYGSTSTTYPDTMVAVLPELNTQMYPMSANRLTFWARMGSGSNDNTKKVYVGAMSDPTDGSTLTITDSVEVSGTTYVRYIGKLTNANGAYAVLMVKKGSGYVYIDNVTLEEAPTCLDVTEVNFVSATNNSITINWVPNAANSNVTYSVYNGEVLVASNIADTFYTVIGLTGNTEYTLGVVVNCANSDSPVLTVTGRTECDLMTQLPYTCDFENSATGSSTNNVFDVDCWHRLNNATQYYGYPYISSTAHESSRSTYWYAATTTGTYGDYQCLVLPGVGGNYAMNNLRLRFWSKATSSSYRPVFLVGVMSDPNDINTFEFVDSVKVNQAGNTTDWAKYTANLINYSGNGRYVAIRANRPASYWYAYIDDVTLEEIPSCLEVENLVVAAADANSITLDWDDNYNTSATYSVYNDSALVQSGITSTSYTVTGLQPTTDYTFTVVANCSANDASEAVSVSGTTTCAAVQIPYIENFDAITTSTTAATGVHVDCWSYTMTGSSTYQTASYQPQVYYSTTYANSGNYSLRLYGVSYTCLPPMAEPLAGLQMSFNAHTTSTTSYKLAVGVMEGTTFVPVDTIIVGSHVPCTVYFSGYNGNSRIIAFRNFNTSSTSYLSTHYIDDVMVDYLPSCVPVTNLEVVGVTDASVTLEWDDLLNDGATYTVSDASGVIASGLTNTTYAVVGLNANTDYTFYVTANCSATASGEAVSVTAHTMCAPYTMPFTENFDSLTSGIPECWSNSEGTVTTASYRWNYYATGYEGHGLRFNSYTAPGGQINVLASPAVAVTADSRLTFMYKNPTGGDFTVMAAIDGGARDILATGLTGVSEWTLMNITLPTTYNGHNVVVYFKGTSNYGSGDAYIYLDDVTIEAMPSCVEVANLAASDITANSVTLTWTDAYNNGATYSVIGPMGLIASGIAATTYTVTNLTPNTEYSFSVLANCSATESSDSVSVVVRTACAALTAADLPYSEDFESYNAGSSATIDPCWTKGTNGTTAYPYPSSTAITGSRSLYFYGYKPSSATGTRVYSYAALPQLDASVDVSGLTVTFKAKRYSSTTASYRSWIYVGVMTDPTDASTFVGIGDINMTSLPANTIETYVVDLANYAGNGKYVAFYCPAVDTTTGISYNYIYIDDVVLDVTPTCSPVAGITASNATTTTVDLAWTDANNTGATYTVYDMSDSTVMGSGITGTSYTVTGLNHSTDYIFGVRANCSADDASPIMTVSARTACGAMSLPFTEDFSTTLTGNPCWISASNATAAQVFAGTALTPSTTGWTYASAERDGLPAGHYYKNVYGTSCKHWLITPEIDLNNVSGAELSFDVALTDYNNAALPDANGDTNSSQAFMVIVSTDGGQTWSANNATVWQNGVGDYSYASLASLNYQNKVIDLTPYVGNTVRIAFYAQSLWSGGDNDLHIDNIAVTGTSVSLCDTVTNVTIAGVTDSSITVTFTTTNAPSYDVHAYIGLTDIMVTTTTGSATITGLQPSTTYYVRVQAHCDSNTWSILSETIEVTTAAETQTCDTPTALAVNYIGGNNSAAELTWTSDASLFNISVNGVVTYGFATASPATITGLDPNTTYTVMIQASCGTDTSEWTAPVSFTTPCAAVELPFTETFESTSATLACWSFDGPGSWQYGSYSSTAATYEGSNYAYIRHSANSNVTKLISPVLDVTGATGVQLSYAHIQKSWSGDQDQMRVYYRTSATDNWIMAAEYTTEISNWTVNDVLLPATVYQVAFEMTDGYGYGVAIDSVVFTALTSAVCFPVNNIAINDLTSTSATLTWNGDASSYLVTVTDGITNAFNNVVNDTAVALTGLTAETNYMINIYAICGAGDTSDVETYTFYTGYCTPTPSSVDGQGITSVSFGGMINTTSHAGNTAAYVNNSNMSGNVSAGTTATVEIEYATGYTYGTIIWVDWNSNLTFEGNEVVYVGNSTNANPTTLTATFDIPATQALGGYRMRIVGADSYFDSYIGSIAAAANANPCASYSWGVAEDYTITVTEAPACLTPSNLEAVYIGGNNNAAVVSWVSDAAAFNISVNGTVTYNVNNPDTLTGLDFNTIYTVMVQANCGTDTSAWTLPVSFTTPCAAVDLPYTETFEAASATRNCWTLEATGNIGGTNGMGFVTVNNRETLRFSSYSSASDYNQYAYSPLMNVSNDANALNLSITYATYGNTDSLWFGYVTATDTVWTSNSFTTGGNSDFQTYNTIIPAEATHVAIHYFGNYKYYAWIDTVAISEITGGVCYQVTNLTVDSVTTNSVSLSWNDVDNNGATYTVYNDTAVVATGVTVTNYTVTGLTANTQYTFGVVANCSATDASTMATVTARTACGAVAIPYVEDFENGIDCWTMVDVAASTGVTTNNPYSGTHAFKFNWNTNPPQYLISPELTGTEDGLNVSFMYRVGSASYAESFQLGYSTTTNDTSAFVWGTEIDSITSVTYAAYSETLPAGTKYVAIKYTANDMLALYVDSLVFESPVAQSDSVMVIAAPNFPAHGTVALNGNASAAAVNAIFHEGDTIVATATPDSGYLFDYWAVSYVTSDTALITVNDTVYTNPFVLVVDSNVVSNTMIALKANYISNSGIADSMTIVMATADATMGTTNPQPGTYRVALGDTLMMNSVAYDGYHFTHWTYEIVGLSNTPNIITEDTLLYTGEQWLLDRTINMVAYFAPDSIPVVPSDSVTFILTVNDTTMGTTNPVPGTYTYAVGDSAMVEAIANQGYRFDYWLVTVMGMSDTLRLPMYAAVLPAELGGMTIEVEAVFVANKYHIVGVSNDTTMGRVLGSGWYTEGSVATLSAMANTGYRFVQWSSGETTPTLQIVVTEDVNVTAIFDTIGGGHIGIEDADEPEITVWSTGMRILVEGAEGRDVRLFDVNGRMIGSAVKASETVEFRVNATGVYLVKVGNAPAKRVLVVR